MTKHQIPKEASSGATPVNPLDPSEIDQAFADWYDVRSQFADPDTYSTDEELTALMTAESAAVEKVALTPAVTLERLISKFTLLSSELSDINAPRRVRLLAIALQTDTEQLINES